MNIHTWSLLGRAPRRGGVLFLKFTLYSRVVTTKKMRFSDSTTQLLLLSPFLSHGAYGLKVGGFRCTAMPSFAHFGARKEKAKASSSAAAWLEPEGFSELSQVTVPEGDTEGKAEDYVGRFDFSLESPHRPEDVSKYRRAVVGGLALATIFSPHLNRALAKVWSTVRVTWFRNDMFEPLVAVGFSCGFTCGSA